MRILLRDIKTARYATGTGEWIKKREDAHDFGKSPQAYEHAKKFQLVDAEVVFAHDDQKKDFALPPKPFPITKKA